MEAGDDAVETVRGAGGEQRRASARVAEHGIGLRFSGAVAGVDPDIGTGPTPRGHDRRAVRRRLGILVDERDAGQLVSADGRIELVVDAGAHDVVGDARIRGQRDWRCGEAVGERSRKRAKIHVEVFDFAGHVAEQAALEARTDGPARLDREHAHGRGDHARVAVGIETDAGQVDGGSDRADGETAGGIGHHVGRDGRAKTPAHGAEPIEVMALHEVRRHRRIEPGSRIADCAGTDIVRRGSLPRHLDVGFEAGNPIARLPIVAGLDAADCAVELVRGAGGEQRRARCRIAEGCVGLRLAGAVSEVEPEIRAGPTPGEKKRRLVEHRRARTCRALVIASLRFLGGRLGAELGVHEKFDAAPGLKNFVLVELHGIAHVDVEQVLADEPGRDEGRAPGRVSPIFGVLDSHPEQVVAGGGRVVDAEVALPEGVQEAHAHEPVVGAPVGAAAEPHRRHARDIAAVGKSRAHEVVLAVDAENAGRHGDQIPLPGELGAAEDGVALGIDGLDESGIDAVAAGRKRRAAEDAGRLAKDEVVVIGVIGLGVEAEIALDALQPELGSVAGFDFQVRIADLERAGRVVRAVGKKLERGRRALDALHGGACDHPRRQVLEQLEADALGQEAE